MPLWEGFAVVRPLVSEGFLPAVGEKRKNPYTCCFSSGWYWENLLFPVADKHNFRKPCAEEVTSTNQLDQHFTARLCFLILRFIDDMVQWVDTKAISTSKYLSGTLKFGVSIVVKIDVAKVSQENLYLGEILVVDFQMSPDPKT